MNAYYEAHKKELKIPEKRKVKYALVDMQAIRNRTQVSPQDIQRYYEDNQQQYSTPNRCAPATSCSRPKARTTRR